jgi:hypothetical protein
MDAAVAQLDPLLVQDGLRKLPKCSIGKFVTVAVIMGLLSICPVCTGERRLPPAAS